jgi:hypothetical protein
MSDVGADHLLVSLDGRDKVSLRPEFMTQKIPQLAEFSI